MVEFSERTEQDVKGFLKKRHEQEISCACAKCGLHLPGRISPGMNRPRCNSASWHQLCNDPC